MAANAFKTPGGRSDWFVYVGSAAGIQAVWLAVKTANWAAKARL